jgi:hypothetical protein
MQMMKQLFALCLLLLLAGAAFSQARSSFGFTLGVNQTFHKYDHELNPGAGLIGNIRIIDALAIEPAIGIYEVSDYAVARLSAKFYVTNRTFITAGRIAWLGSDIRTGWATSVSAGYRIFNKPRRNFEVSVHGNFGRYIYNSTPVVGLRAAYNFNFRKL